MLRAVMEYLAVKRIFAMRMNSGAVQDRRGIPVRMHEPGTADILALVNYKQLGYGLDAYWIECKAENGRQSDLQKQFQAKVEDEGHIYIIARGIEDLQKVGL